jgi:hypothetical protein
VEFTGLLQRLGRIAVAAAALALVAAGGSHEMAQQARISEVAERAQAINRQLVTRTKEDLKTYTPDRVAVLTSEFRNLITDYLLLRLDEDPALSAECLTQELRGILGAYSLPKHVTHSPYVGHHRWEGGESYVVAYLINRGGVGAPDSKAVIQLYSKLGRRFVLSDETSAGFDRHTLFIRGIQARRENESWYLFYGTRFGDSQNTMRVTLHAVDSKRIRQLWSRSDLPRGEITLENGFLSLKYLDIRRYQEARPPYFKVETYRFAENGLEKVVQSPAPRDSNN